MRDVAFVVDADYSMMALAVVMAFEVANSVADRPAYVLHFVSETGGRVKSSCGLMLESEPFTETPFHTLFIGGATSPIDRPQQARRRPCRSRRSGDVVLARPSNRRSQERDHRPRQVLSAR
jgi:transcriptional regulator GlxA family with amidase domain